MAERQDDELMHVEQLRQELEQALRECREQLARTEVLLREVNPESAGLEASAVSAYPPVRK